jgi:hypothetical protein
MEFDDNSDGYTIQSSYYVEMVEFSKDPLNRLMDGLVLAKQRGPSGMKQE